MLNQKINFPSLLPWKFQHVYCFISCLTVTLWHLTSQLHADFLSIETFKWRFRHFCPSLDLLLQQVLVASVSQSCKKKHRQRTAHNGLDWDLYDALKNDWGVIHCANPEIYVQAISGDKNPKFNLYSLHSANCELFTHAIAGNMGSIWIAFGARWISALITLSIICSVTTCSVLI